MNGLPFAILLVDDDEDDRIIIDEAFVAIGYECEVKKFIDGEALLRYLEKVEPELYPSLIVLDHSLTKLNAPEILELLKKDDRYRHIPVVIYSTVIPPQKKKDLLEMGAYACWEKGSLISDVVGAAEKLRDFAVQNQK